MERVFKPRLGIWLGLSAGVSLLLAIGLYETTLCAAERSALVGRSQDVLIGLRLVTSLVDEAVIAVRGFALSKQEAMLVPYHRAAKQIGPALAKVRGLTYRDTSQRARVAELRVLVERRLALMNGMLDVLRNEGISKGWEFIKVNGVDDLIERIRLQVEAIETAEKGMLDRRVAEVSMATRLTYWLFLMGIVGNLGIILLAFRGMGREVKRRALVEATLRQSEARFRGTFEAAAVGMGVMSLDGRWLEVNTALCGIVGYREEELLGMDCRLLTHPADIELDTSQMTDVRDGRLRSCRYEKRYISKSGRTIPISISASVVTDDAGVVSYVVTLVEDISARKRAESWLAAQHAVAMILAENRTLDESIPAILAAIGSLLGYCVGEYWDVDRSCGKLVSGGVWWDRGKIDADSIRASQWMRFSFGEGLPGLAWEQVEPVVVEDMTRDGRFVRAELAPTAGLRGAVGFAVVGSGGPIAVMTFLSREMSEGDEDFRATLFTLGRQIGLFVERRNAELAAAEAASRMRAIFDKTVQFMGLLDRKGTLIEANQKALDFCGVTRDEVIGRPFSEGPWWAGSREIRERLEESIRRASLGETARFEAEHPGADGRAVTVDFSLTPVKDERGEVTLMIPEGHDITILKRTSLALQEREEQFRLLLESVKDHEIIMLDPGGCVVSWNAAAESIKGYRAEEIIGRHFSIFYPEHSVEQGEPKRALETARREGRWSGEGWRRRKDGSLFWANVLLSPVRDHEGTLRGFAKVTRDETERRQAESELLKAKEAAEAANRAKGEFLANMSHEIRTPMNGIIGMTELALETELSARQREYLGLVKSSADSLLTVINDILDFSKIEAGKLEVSPSEFLLRELVEETVQTLALRAHGKGLRIACRIAARVPDAVFGDAGRLRQIIVNLLGNAIKFTGCGSILLNADLADGEGTSDEMVMLHVSIRDTGVGIAREKQLTIFEPFEQADNSTTRRFGGTGLGLTISRELVLMMGGRIWVESEVGEGSVFHFTVALKRSDRSNEDRAEGRSVAAGMRVLVVDKSEIPRRILTEVLASWGAESHELEEPEAIVGELESGVASGRPYGVVIVDIESHEIDPGNLERWIRSDAKLSDTVLLMMATDAWIERQAQGQMTKLTGWLPKPVRQSALLNALSKGNDEMRKAAPGETQATSGEMGARTEQESGSPSVELKVLLAEDHPVNQKLAVRLLEKAGYRVTVVADGRQALEAIEAEAFDVVLMDVSMPVMGGFEAIERIRAMADEAKKRLPVIALTAHAMVGDRERCLAQGFDGYVAKPVSGQALREAIEGVVGAGVSGAR